METEMTKEQQDLVEKNHKLIYWFLNKWHFPEDEYYGTAAVALCKAAMTYDPARASFSTYALKVMKMEVANEMRVRGYSVNATVSLDADLGEDMSTLNDIIPSDVDLEYEVHTRSMLQHVLSLCTEWECRVLLMLGQGYTQTEIAELIGCSKQYVNAQYLRLRRRLENLRCNGEI